MGQEKYTEMTSTFHPGFNATWLVVPIAVG